MTTREYPKRVWLLFQAVLVEQDGKEYVDHDHDVVLAMTKSPAVADLLISKLREKENKDTLVRSGIQTLPSAILEMLDEDKVDNSTLMDIANATAERGSDET